MRATMSVAFKKPLASASPLSQWDLTAIKRMYWKTFGQVSNLAMNTMKSPPRRTYPDVDSFFHNVIAFY